MKYSYLAIGAALTCATNSALAAPEKAWITVEAHAMAHYQKQQKTQWQSATTQSIAGTAVDVIAIDPKHIHRLSDFMHHEYKRCGGFIYHESEQAAKAYLQQAQVNNTQTVATVNYSIDNPAAAQALLAELSTTRLDNTVSTLAAFHNRYYSQQSGVDAADWLRTHWQQIASSRSDITVQSYNHSWAQDSVVVTIAGQELSDEVVIIGGHLDSINQSSPSQGRAPGADDNASGIAVLTETLRAVVDSDFKPKRTIKIMGFAAEEVGLRGSGAIASDYKSQGINVVGMAQFDMTGNNGSAEDIVLMTDYTNSGQNQFMANLASTYLSDLVIGYDQCGYGCSDHASWHNQGFAASMPFESKMSDINYRIHTSGDDQFDASHAINFARLASVYLAELAKSAGSAPPPPSDNELTNGVVESGLSAGAKEQLLYTMDVPSDATDLNFNTYGGSGDADLYVQFGTPPTLNSYDCKSTTASSTESCSFSAPQTGTYYVMVEAWNAISGVNLVGEYQTDSTGPTPINRSEGPISVASSQWQRFEQPLTSGYSQLQVSISGGSGDADLYLNLGSPSSQSQWQCRPYKNGNNETCTISNPQSGTWYIDLYGYNSATGVNLSITAN